MTADLQAMADWQTEGGVTHVVMESTGVYWQPINNILEGRFEVFLVNAQAVKRMPGRKTDLKDAEWLATLMQHGLLQRSFIPDRQQRELHELARYRLSLVQERSRFASRLQKVLEDTNIKLSAVATDMQGVSAQAMIRALVQGEADSKVLAGLAKGRMRKKQGDLERAWWASSPSTIASCSTNSLISSTCSTSRSPRSKRAWRSNSPRCRPFAPP